MNKSKSFLLTFISTILLVVIDQITKYIAVINLLDNKSIPLIENVLEFYYVQNTGAAFSLLSNYTVFFVAFVPIVVGWIIFFYCKIPKDIKFLPLKICIIFIIAGAIGNWIDRLFLGYVRDFIYFSLINFPVFNVADIYVTCSVFVLFVLIIFKYKDNDLEKILKKDA